MLLLFLFCLATSVLAKTITYEIGSTWDGNPIVGHNATVATIGAAADGGIQISMEATLFNEPHLEGCLQGYAHEDILNHESIAFFFVDPSVPRYLSMAFSPCGAHLVAFYQPKGTVLLDLLQISYMSQTDAKGLWRGEAVIPISYFPPNITKFNAFSIHNNDTGDRFVEAIFPVKSGPQGPDLHNLEAYGDIGFNNVANITNLSDVWKAALDEELMYKLDHTWQGDLVSNPAKVVMSNNETRKEMNISVIWDKNILEDPNSLGESSHPDMIFLFANKQNMFLQIEFNQMISKAQVSLLWGPEGAWGYEIHHLDPEDNDYIGGHFKSNISQNLWIAEVIVPWDLLPPSITDVQIVHMTREENNSRVLFPGFSIQDSMDLGTILEGYHPFDSKMVVDSYYNRNISPIWSALTSSAVLQTAAVVTLGIVAALGAGIAVKYGGHIYGHTVNANCCGNSDCGSNDCGSNNCKPPCCK